MLLVAQRLMGEDFIVTYFAVVPHALAGLGLGVLLNEQCRLFGQTAPVLVAILRQNGDLGKQLVACQRTVLETFEAAIVPGEAPVNSSDGLVQGPHVAQLDLLKIQFVIFGTFAAGLHHDDFEFFDCELVVLQFLGCFVVGIGDLALCHEADAIESREVVHLLSNGRGEHTKKGVHCFIGQA